MSKPTAVRRLPIVAFTVGDVAGIGPEVIARSLANPEWRARYRSLVVGPPSILRDAVRLCQSSLSLTSVSSPAEVESLSSDAVAVWNPTSVTFEDSPPRGVVDPRAGRAAYDYLIAATDAALSGTVDAIVTAPLNKFALHAAGIEEPGHTEILARRCGVPSVAMMLYLPPGGVIQGPHGLCVAHCTLHTAISTVPASLSPALVAGTGRLVADFLPRLGCANPRIAICALNPHAGEEGLFGDEESRVIAPGVRRLVAQGIQAQGPFPADTLIRRAVGGEFDGLVAMYHDQGHIAFKLIGFDRAVNITLGLPIIRTSPSHGTAFEIAWQGLARADGFTGAVQVALQLIEDRERRQAV